ncbi:MAG TPA: sulfatase-like hydrolase/transferase [Lacipirellula sp.]
MTRLGNRRRNRAGRSRPTSHGNDGRSSRIEQLEPRLALASMPNIIVINTDDQRFDTLQYMPTVQSQLVPNSAKFINSFVPTPICSPSRASLLTGLYAHNHGVLHVLEPWGGFENFNDSSTLATWLDAAGYNTAMIGKYINGYDLTAHANQNPNDTYVPPGWDEWRAMLGASFNSPTFSVDGVAQDFAGQYTADVMADMADEFIRANNDADETPFFLYFAPHNPHAPAVPAPRHNGAFDNLAPYRPPSFNEADISDKPQWVKNQLDPMTATEIAAVDQFRKDQLESLLSVDDAVNQMLSALRQTGQLDNTIIIYTSDNGQHWGEHRFDEKGPAWDESIRVPLIIYDGRNPTSQTIDEMALNIDLAPTILQMAGVAPQPARDGKSLVQLINGNDAGWRDEFLIERYIGDGGKYYGIRTERYTYTEYQFTPGVELYDNLNDPYQLVSQHNNGAYAAVKADLAARLNALRSADRTGPVTSNLNAIVGADGVITLTATVNDSTTGGDEVRNAEYFIDAIGTTGLGTAMRPADGLYNNVAENMVTQIGGLSPGVHTIYVHGRDLSGNWGPFVSIQVGGQTQNPSVVYRINAGGVQLAGSPGWAVDTGASPSPFSNATSGGNSGAFKVSAAINMTHSSIPAGTPTAVFQDDRFDKPGGANLLWDFPVTPGQYEVRLYFAENYAPTAVVGGRVFDVTIEGATVLDNYDIFADVGKHKGVVKSFIVNSDGNLGVDFLRGVQNPLVSGIEILKTNQQAPSALNPSATSLNFGNVNVGQTATRQVTLTNSGQSGQSSITITPSQATITPAGSPYAVSFSQSGPIVLAPGQSTIVMVAYTPTSTGTKNATLLIPHSGGNSPLSISLTGNGVAVQQPTVLYRVNAGGPQIAGSPAWTADTAASPSPYNNADSGGNSGTSLTTAAINMTHPSIPPGTPMAVFQSERFDKPSGANLLWDFAVTPGQYEVRLYLAETYSGTSIVGGRVFDVTIEGATVLDNYDIFADVGKNKGVVKSFLVASNANLDIDFLRGVQNPTVRGIEIVSAGSGAAVFAASFSTSVERMSLPGVAEAFAMPTGLGGAVLAAADRPLELHTRHDAIALLGSLRRRERFAENRDQALGRAWTPEWVSRFNEATNEMINQRSGIDPPKPSDDALDAAFGRLVDVDSSKPQVAAW